MIEVVHVQQVRSTAAHAFDVMIRHNVENHPRWEKEVLEVRSLDDTVGVGHRSVMVRHEGGRTRDVVNECVEYVADERAAFASFGPSMDFWIRFDFADTEPGQSTLTSTVRFSPKGPARLLSPLLRLGGPKRSARISANAARVIEQTPAWRADAS